MDILNTYLRSIDVSFLFLGYPISGLSRSEISIVYLQVLVQHLRLGYSGHVLNRFKIYIVYLCDNEISLG